MDFQRARSPEQRDQRYQQIIDGTLQLYREIPYHEITLSQIARKIGFTRSNLYKYVSTKEEIFLYIILIDMRNWVNDLEKSFSRRVVNRIDFARIWSEVLGRHGRLMELFALLHTIIEHNVSLEALIEYKSLFFTDFPRIFKILETSLPGFTREQLEQFMMAQFYYIRGLYPATQVTDLQREAIKAANIFYRVPDFQTELTNFILIYLKGLEYLGV